MNLKSNTKRKEAIVEIGRQYSDITIMMHEAIARKLGLTGTDHKYLGFILQKGSMTAGEFSKITGLTTGATTGLIDRLEKKKLVKRVFDKTDRRKIMIEPSIENASKLLGGVFGELQKKMTELLNTYSESELQIIEHYILSATKMMVDLTDSLQKPKNIIKTKSPKK